MLSNGNESVSSHSYAYDLIGNRTSSTDNGVAKVYTANDLNQYTEIDSVEFEYDADGNLLSDGKFTYEYDSLNQLISVSTEAAKEVFVYDFMGRRIATESYFRSGNEWILSTRLRYVYQGWNVIAEYVNGAQNRTYVWGEDLSGALQGAGGVGGLLLEQNADGDYMPVYDGNGNIVSYKNDSGSTVSTYSYDPFGNIISHAGMAFTYKFSTKPQDELSGFYYYGYRFYQPTLGRWINRDPIRESGGINLYSILGNSINNLIDYLGMEECVIHIVIGHGKSNKDKTVVLPDSDIGLYAQNFADNNPSSYSAVAIIGCWTKQTMIAVDAKRRLQRKRPVNWLYDPYKSPIPNQREYAPYLTGDTGIIGPDEEDDYIPKQRNQVENDTWDAARKKAIDFCQSKRKCCKSVTIYEIKLEQASWFSKAKQTIKQKETIQCRRA